MKTAGISSAVLFTMVLAASPAAQAEETDLSVSLAYRPRAEAIHKRTPETNYLVSHRAAIGVAASRDAWTLFGEARDARNWGKGPDPIAGDGQLTLHQATLQYGAPEAWVRVGRQEINYLNQRLIGSLDWAQPGRSFDGIRGRAVWDRVVFDGFAASISEAVGRGTRDHGLAAGTIAWTNAGRALAAFAAADWRPRNDRKTWTFGPYSEGKLGAGFGYRVEAYGQTHAVGGNLSLAYLVGGEANWTRKSETGGFRIAAGYDRLSGADASRDQAAFDTLYATNHKFYGHMDLFLNLPRDTAGLGLQDAWAGVSGNRGRWSAYATGHHFLPETGGTGAFGSELDLGLGFQAAEKVRFDLFYSILDAGPSFQAANPNAPNYPTWGALQVTAAL